MRLNKYLAAGGVASRRKADELIAGGHVQVNGRLITTLGVEVVQGDVVEVDGRALELKENEVVYLLHKPQGVISSVTDSRGRPTVVDIIQDQRRLFPVGRLDRDTTGALLITNDGKLANLLTHPRYGVEKCYLAQVKGRLPSGGIKQLGRGTTIEDGIKVRARVSTVSSRGSKTIYQVLLTEGKNREVKRIFQHYGLSVVRLHRVTFAGLSADTLQPGKYRRLSKPEVQRLYKLAKPGKYSQSDEKQMDIHVLQS
ncbi:pseudouridine synthase [Candidatus Neomarinimicrobiota bacterium]